MRMMEQRCLPIGIRPGYLFECMCVCARNGWPGLISSVFPSRLRRSDTARARWHRIYKYEIIFAKPRYATQRTCFAENHKPATSPLRHRNRSLRCSASARSTVVPLAGGRKALLQSFARGIFFPLNVLLYSTRISATGYGALSHLCVCGKVARC